MDLSCLALCSSWTWLNFPFIVLGNFSAITSSSIFLRPLSLSSPSETCIMQVLVHLLLFQRFLRLSLFSLFLLYSALPQWFPPSCFNHFYAPVDWFPLYSYCIHHVYWFLLIPIVFIMSIGSFFSSSRSLVNIYWNFFILSPRTWIIFIIIILNSFFWEVAYLHFI